MQPGAALTLPWRTDFNALVYVLGGSGTVGAERRPVRSGQLAVLGAGDTVTVRADATQDSRSPALDVLLLGGRPIREPVAWYGPFVMNTRGRAAAGVRGLPGRQAGHHPRPALSHPRPTFAAYAQACRSSPGDSVPRIHARLEA